jgi:large subunit ribosomal protein L18
MKLSKKLFRKRQSLRGSIKGTSERPRLSVFRSNIYLYAQIIDDINSQTLVSYSTNCPDFKSNNVKINTNSCISAKILGQKIANLCLEKNINQIIFDRGPYLYHGQIKAIADGARAEGLKF